MNSKQMQQFRMVTEQYKNVTLLSTVYVKVKLC